MGRLGKFIKAYLLENPGATRTDGENAYSKKLEEKEAARKQKITDRSKRKTYRRTPECDLAIYDCGCVDGTPCTDTMAIVLYCGRCFYMKGCMCNDFTGMYVHPDDGIFRHAMPKKYCRQLRHRGDTKPAMPYS
jgi:hypothetical protein